MGFERYQHTNLEVVFNNYAHGGSKKFLLESIFKSAFITSSYCTANLHPEHKVRILMAVKKNLNVTLQIMKLNYQKTTSSILLHISTY